MGYICHQCFYTSDRRSEVCLHMWTKHLTDIHSHICTCCPFFTDNLKKLQKHIKYTHCPSSAYQKKVKTKLNKAGAAEKNSSNSDSDQDNSSDSDYDEPIFFSK